ncbi:hypothetical protein BDV96DRAFT_48310 [Lophiotrema nucula]|uniref:Chitin-binding type-1 domain-containing protein n=1 Tax=Lophiotrema nucula TaxID=690887 RepID=A0A6A5ZD17_9PLEO|nr:hypothetical protein BDV96DRAFT_48310 [Lophiotrema nucula]
MGSCVFDSPELTTLPTGALIAPTFAFDAANTNYLGLPGSFVSNVFQGKGTACSFPTRSVGLGRTSTYAITPIIVTTSGTTAKTTVCNVLKPSSIVPSTGGSTTYSGIECPSATNNQFAPGTYTLRFDQPNVIGVPKIASRVFSVASPMWATILVTDIILSTETASTIPASTATITQFTLTSTFAPSFGSNQTTTTTITSTSSTTITISGADLSCSSSSAPLVSSPSLGSSSLTPGNATSSASSPGATLKVSLDGACGSLSGQTCLGSTFGDCCSSYGYCGNTDVYCQASEGCQSGFGDCIAPSPVSSSILPTSTVKVSLDGSCGGTNEYICRGSGFGDCCSPYGWCGSLAAHCGAGCQVSFGSCNASTSATGTAPLPSSTLKVSLDGACGDATGQTCLGSDFGNCCSPYGYCGKTDTYCSTGCQTAFGTCSPSLKRSIPVIRHPFVEKRAIGGAGPDYTYPPIPTTIVTSSITQTTTVALSQGVTTTTVLGIATTTVGGSGGVVIITERVNATTTVIERVCSV